MVIFQTSHSNARRRAAMTILWLGLIATRSGFGRKKGRTTVAQRTRCGTAIALSSAPPQVTCSRSTPAAMVSACARCRRRLPAPRVRVVAGTAPARSGAKTPPSGASRLTTRRGPQSGAGFVRFWSAPLFSTPRRGEMTTATSAAVAAVAVAVGTTSLSKPLLTISSARSAGRRGSTFAPAARRA